MSTNVSNGQFHNKTRRLIVGFLLLLIVNLLWVASSELTRWLFKDDNFDKAFLTTYLKTCLFTIYLLGFVFHRPWREQCLRGNENAIDSDDNELDELNHDPNLSEPHYEPLRRSSDCDSDKSSIVSVSDTEFKEEVKPKKKSRLVRFSGVKEVRRLPDNEAEAALLARLPHEVYMRASKLVQQYQTKLSIKKVAKLALQFCFIWFIGNFAYQEALRFTEPGVVNVLSSTSSLFTCIFAACFPSTSNDKLTLSKICVVALSIGGVCAITWVDKGTIEFGVPRGAIWSLVGSIFYAFYLVLLRKRVDSEDKLDIPMFFGFVGLFCLVLLSPCLYLLHVSGVEPFYPLPTQTQMMYIVINGILGTVLSEYLWLWGCFLTSSLVATMSLSLTVPLTVLADSLFHRTQYSMGFYVGAVPIVLSFVFASLLVHYDNWDPVYCLLRRVFHKCIHFCRACSRKICKSRTKQVHPLSSDETANLLLDSV